MSKFTLGSSTSPSPTSTPAYAYSEDEDEDTLPYPGELPRKDFLAPDFDPQTYLSSLRNRHQTLEDLRSDLRQRSQMLNEELLDLVNGNYEAFLGLGGDLKGGEEKVEGVRVGLLGFKREVDGLQRRLKEKLVETRELLKERKALRRDISFGRSLVDVEERLCELEESLGIKDEAEEIVDAEFDDDDDDLPTARTEETNVSRLLKRSKNNVEQHCLIIRQIERLGPEHSFLQNLRSRLDDIRKTLLLDLATAFRQARATANTDAVMALMPLFATLGAEKESLRLLRGG